MREANSLTLAKAYLMITVIGVAEFFWHSIVVCLRQEPFYGGTLFGLKQKERENRKYRWKYI